MTITRILVAVDDSPAALAAARTALDIARRYQASVRLVHVEQDGALVRALAGFDNEETIDERRTQAASSLLRHVLSQAKSSGLSAEAIGLEGDPASTVLAQIGDWKADLVVLGRSWQRGAGRPYLGAVSRQVLEFSEVPVLIVPQPPS
jgi:nucleotide-binding universal stress UspA family protein